MDKQYKEIYEELRSNIKGKVTLTNANDSSQYDTDFGSVCYKRPKIIVEVECEQDICYTLKIANSYNKKVTVRGAGHSLNGQALSDEILIVNYTLDQEEQIRIIDNDLVEVPTRLTWGTLEKKLNQSNLSFPVLTNNLFASIGGTLSICGIGERSIKNGTQIDQVVRLKLILPNGNIIWCSEEEHADLFRFSLTGLGSLGVIETVVMKTIPYKITTTHFTPLSNHGKEYLNKAIDEFIAFTQHDPTPECALMVLHFEGLMKDRSGIFYGYEHSPDQKDIIVGNNIFENEGPVTIEANHYIESHNVILKWCKQFEDDKKLWMDYFFEPEQAKKFLQKIKSLPMAPYLSCLYFLSLKRPPRSPSLPLHPLQFKNKPYISIGPFFHVPKDDIAGLLKVKNLIKILSEECLALGGKPYLYGSMDLNDNNKYLIYGKNYDELIKLKQKYDPHHIMNSPLNQTS